MPLINIPACTCCYFSNFPVIPACTFRSVFEPSFIKHTNFGGMIFWPFRWEFLQFRGLLRHFWLDNSKTIYHPIGHFFLTRLDQVAAWCVNVMTFEKMGRFVLILKLWFYSTWLTIACNIMVIVRYCSVRVRGNNMIECCQQEIHEGYFSLACVDHLMLAVLSFALVRLWSRPRQSFPCQSLLTARQGKKMYI